MFIKRFSNMLACIALCLTIVQASSADIALHAGMSLNQSGKVHKLIWRLDGSDATPGGAALTISASNAVIDFNGSIIEGTPEDTEPDARKGTGLLITGSNVTVKNLTVRGYKVGILGRGARGLRLINADCSYNWKQQLASTQESEDLADWMSYHQNEKDEWLRYGAGIYLRGCDDFEIQRAKVHGGQCGLMLTECNRGMVWNSDFSYLSGIGIGMYESSDNRIMHNKIDWCVRGYSHGVYNRGQDSAGILIYEQSNRNTFAYNSVTHGGDGFFLWAGQRTMDSGQGGCNDNLVYGCDFSHSPTNGIEATFSRNTFANCLVMECWHGIWGGYSFDTQVLGCLFAYNGEAIAIEHGQNNRVQDCVFYRDATGIHLWQKPSEDPLWGYPKHHDTRSHGFVVQNSIFSDIVSPDATAIPGHAAGHGTAFRIKATSDFLATGCTFGPLAGLLDARGPLTSLAIKGSGSLVPTTSLWNSLPSLDDLNVEHLGTGWTADTEGLMLIPGSAKAPLAPVSHNSGAPVLPAGEGFNRYADRFATNWDPLSTPDDSPTIGRAAGGHFPPVSTDAATALAPPPLAGGMNPFLKPGARRGRASILVDNWGPIDYLYPVIWPRQNLKDQTLPSSTEPGSKEGDLYEIVGPAGKWTLKKVEGGTLSAQTGKVPGWVRLKRTGAAAVRIQLEYVGSKTVDYRGMVKAAGEAVAFEFADQRVPIDWHVRFYRYDKAIQEPRTMLPQFQKLIAGKPLATSANSGTVLNLVPGGIPKEVGSDYFATVSEGDFEVQAGDYTLDVTMDDGARVYLDDKLIIDEWHYQAPTLYSRELKLQGKHHLKIEHFQIDGYWTLKVAMRKKSGK